MMSQPKRIRETTKKARGGVGGGGGDIFLWFLSRVVHSLSGGGGIRGASFLETAEGYEEEMPVAC